MSEPDKSPGVDCDATSSKAEGVEGLPDPRQVLDDMESLVQNAYEMKLVMATYLIAYRTLANERDEAVRLLGLEGVKMVNSRLHASLLNKGGADTP